MKNFSRRAFIKQTAFTTAVLGLSARSWSRSNGANGDVRVAVVGFHGRGESHIEDLKKIKGARLVALCDVDKGVLARGVDKLKKGGIEVTPYADIRKLLENKDIDAISIATPNHWHALGAIWGIQAGKDVYLEKPVSHNVWEGRQIVRAAEKYKKVVQTGTQSRSSTAIAEAVDYVQKGNLGKIILARGLCYKPRTSLGKTSGPQKVPDEIDYDLWSGPAPLVAPHRNTPRFGTVHYDWHWFWNYGSGDLGNQGIHQMDIARWFLGERDLSPRVMTVGGRLGYEDDGETPNTLFTYHDYKKAPLIFEVRGLPEKTGSTKMDKLKGVEIGVIVQCEGGSAIVTSNYGKATILDKEDKEIKSFEGNTSHFANFINAVRSRKASDNKAPIVEGHISSALCHTANISYRLGTQKDPNAIREAVKANKEATETLDRMSGHLGANNVDLTRTQLTLGKFLKMDPKTERFSDDEANALSKDKYRAPFVVPEQV
jgi:predicted dehydrogenase